MQGGRYDCIVGGITITPERERVLAWSVPYITTTLSLVVNGAKTPAVRSLADLRHASVGVQAGDDRLRRGARDASAGRTRQYKSLSI